MSGKRNVAFFYSVGLRFILREAWQSDRFFDFFCRNRFGIGPFRNCYSKAFSIFASNSWRYSLSKIGSPLTAKKARKPEKKAKAAHRTDTRNYKGYGGRDSRYNRTSRYRAKVSYRTGTRNCNLQGRRGSDWAGTSRYVKR
jgi:hypothetical protein